MKRLLSKENVGGREELWWLHTGDDGKDRITVETVQDVEPILDQNKREFAAASDRFGKGSFHKVATIPSTVIEEICRRSEEHTSELQSLMRISYAVFCLKKKNRNKRRTSELRKNT